MMTPWRFLHYWTFVTKDQLCEAKVFFRCRPLQTVELRWQRSCGVLLRLQSTANYVHIPWYIQRSPLLCRVSLHSGRSPSALTLESVKAAGYDKDKPLPITHGNCVTVPGAAATWVDLIKKFGSGKVAYKIHHCSNAVWATCRLFNSLFRLLNTLP